MKLSLLLALTLSLLCTHPVCAGLTGAMKEAIEHYTAAEKKEDANDISGAHAELDAALKVEPDFIPAYNKRSLIKRTEGDYKGSLEDSNKAIQLAPSRAEYYVNRSLTYELLHDLKAAKADIEKALQIDPKNEFALEAKAKVGQPISGIENVRLGADGKPLPPTKAESVSSTSSSEPHKPIGPLPTGAEIRDRKQASATYGEGVKLGRAGNKVAAMAAYTKAIQQDPSFPHPYMNRGLLKKDKNDLVGARADFDKVITLLPTNPDPYYARAFISEAEQRFDDAISDMTKAISISPKNAEFYAMRGLVYLRKSDFGNAEKDATKALSLAPKDPHFLWLKGRVAAKDIGPFNFGPSREHAAPSTAITAKQRSYTKQGKP